MDHPTADAAFAAAQREHQAGALASAEGNYRRVIAVAPDHAGATHGLGVLAQQVGRWDVAVALLRRAVALQPDWPGALSNLANALRMSGHPAEAVHACRQAIATAPDTPEAHGNLGLALRDLRQFDAAVEAHRRLVALVPHLVQAHVELGTSLRQAGRATEAVGVLRRAVSIGPTVAAAHHQLGVALLVAGRPTEAVAVLRDAVALEPTAAEPHHNLGLALRADGRPADAVAAFSAALALRPTYAVAHNSLGVTLRDSGLLDDALAACGRAVTLDPAYPEAHNNLGTVLKDVGRLDEAIAAQRQALALRPAYAEAHSNLILTLKYHSVLGSADEEHRYDQRHGRPPTASHANIANPHRRLRVGYVSGDLADHPVGRFLLPLLRHHDRAAVEVFAYPNRTAPPDNVTRELATHVAGWRPIERLSDDQAADAIRADRIDVLIDLSLHTAHNRLGVFAARPAPVQVSYLGYAGRTGLAAIDHHLTDRYLEPSGDGRAVPLAGTYWCYAPPPEAGDVAALPSRSVGVVTFGCLNHFAKVTGPTLAAWADLLRAVPASRLLLHVPPGSARERLAADLRRLGIDPARVGTVSAVTAADYFRQYSHIEVAMDPFPFNGATTTCDALWMGVPVVSLVGPTPVGRAGLSILSHAGLPELAVGTVADYVRVAAGLAADDGRRAELRSTMRQRLLASPLMDAPRFARDVEAAYRGLWARWCADRG